MGSPTPPLLWETKNSDVCSGILTGLPGEDREVRFHPGCHDVRNKMGCAGSGGRGGRDVLLALLGSTDVSSQTNNPPLI